MLIILIYIRTLVVHENFDLFAFSYLHKFNMELYIIHKYNLNIIKLNILLKTKIFKSIFTGLYVYIISSFLKAPHLFISFNITKCF